MRLDCDSVSSNLATWVSAFLILFLKTPNHCFGNYKHRYLYLELKPVHFREFCRVKPFYSFCLFRWIIHVEGAPGKLILYTSWRLSRSTRRARLLRVWFILFWSVFNLKYLKYCNASERGICHRLMINIAYEQLHISKNHKSRRKERWKCEKGVYIFNLKCRLYTGCRLILQMECNQFDVCFLLKCQVFAITQNDKQSAC